ncbi:hypothetical protein [Fusobacterium sp. MFO224]|uniref:hypothetical protein n=1 Tax=Fusobacterium sp. MFO224 TaxID=3378070 RepID=UPI0038554E31
MKGCSFEKSVVLFLAILIILALFLDNIGIVGYLSFAFLVFSVVTSIKINLIGCFFNQKCQEKLISLDLFSSKEKEVQEEALKSFKTLVCR